MSLMDEIIDAEERMHIVLTKNQRAAVEALLEGRMTWAGAYATRVYKSVLEARAK